MYHHPTKLQIIRGIPAIIMMIALFITIPEAEAQIKLYDLNKPIPSKSRTNQRTEGVNPLSLPFWDDFSFTKFRPDDSLWVNSANVRVSPGLGINAPTINVATFDGLDSLGRPYSQDQFADGSTDMLTSCPIDMSGIDENNTSVFISFFYQFNGNGEVPNANDSIRLEFKNQDDEWIRVWGVDGRELINRTTAVVNGSTILTNRQDTIFHQEIFRVINDFYHDDFQFRFTSFGRQSGPFDTWNLDYIYLDDQRSISDDDYPDRALSTAPSSIFSDYTAIPLTHFASAGASNLTSASIEYNNLDDSLQVIDFINRATIRKTNSDTTIFFATQNLDSIFGFVTAPFERRVFQNVDFADITDIVADTMTSFDIQYDFYIRSGDNIPLNLDGDYEERYEPIDFRTNDTVSVSYTLADFYAYDDGEAEFGAGLNQAGDEIAYLFEMRTDDPDTLVSVDFHFPFISNSPAGRQIDLIVLRNLDNTSSSILLEETITLPPADSINAFFEYQLRRSIVVQDSFFIGWRQVTIGDLPIGLDRSNDTGDKIYVNLGGGWMQNTSVMGSLMLRPRFGKPSTVITNLDDPLNRPEIKLYPNPTTGSVTIEGSYDHLYIYNANGKQVKYGFEGTGTNRVNLSDLPNGLYVFQFIEDDQIQTKRIILRQ
ncbi:MAG: T9SS type A sorting domain-containing protein [Bacteroidota bacterium]